MTSTSPNCKGVFQFTPLREGRRGNRYLFARANGFQFTPLREGRLGWGGLPCG